MELGLNETSPFEEIMSTYFPKEERFIFISPEGKILAKCRPDKLNEELKKNFKDEAPFDGDLTIKSLTSTKLVLEDEDETIELFKQ